MGRSRGFRRVVGVALFVAAISACADGEDQVTADTTTTVAPSTTAAAGEDDAAGRSPGDDGESEAGETSGSTTTTAPAVPSRCDPEAAAGIEPVTLRVWHAMDGDVETLVRLIADRFEAEHDGYRVEIAKLETGYPGLIDQLRDTPDELLPDVIMGSNQTVRLQADSGRFIPPAECNGGDEPDQFRDLLPLVRRTFTVEGRLQAAPFNASAPVMFYDARRWERAGLDPTDPPDDLDELVAVIRQLGDSGEVTTGGVIYDRSALWLIEQPASQAGRLLLEPANGRAGLDVERALFNHPEAVEVLATFHELKRDGYIRWNSLNVGNDDLARLVSPTEPSGLTFNSSAVTGDIIRLFEQGFLPDVEIAIAPYPGGGVGGTVGGGAWWIVDNDDPARAGAAWILTDWLTQPALIAELAAYTGYIPTTDRAAEHEITQQRWAEWPVLRVAYDQVVAAVDTDAAAGLQVGPLVDVHRNLELAAAFAIDVGNDPETELVNAEQRSLEIIDLYRDSYTTD